MNTNITYRTISTSDIEKIKKLVDQCRPYVVPHPDYNYWMLAELFPGYSLVAVRGDDIVGYVGACPVNNCSNHVFVIQIAVAPNMRGQAVAFSMLKEIYERFAEKGTGKFVLECTISPNNQPSQNTFRKFAKMYGGTFEKSEKHFEDGNFFEDGYLVVC